MDNHYMTPAEIEAEEMDAEFGARYDYAREAFGDTGYDSTNENDYDPDYLVGGIHPATAAEAISRSLCALFSSIKRDAAFAAGEIWF